MVSIQAIDSDGGGTLSREEVKFAFVDKLKLMDEKDAEALIQALDKNKDKSVSWDEFRWTMNLTQVGHDRWPGRGRLEPMDG